MKSSKFKVVIQVIKFKVRIKKIVHYVSGLIIIIISIIINKIIVTCYVSCTSNVTVFFYGA